MARLDLTTLWRTGACVALLAAISLVPSLSGAAGVLSGCADPNLPPRDTLTLCQKSLRQVDLTLDQRAAVLVNLGVAQAAIGRHSDAETSFGLAIQTRPGLATAYANRARSRMALGRIAEAMADFDAAIERAPADPLVWLGRGSARLRSGEALGAVTDLGRAIQLEPGLTDAYFNRGVALLLSGDAASAVRDFDSVLAESPEDAGARLYRARALAELGSAVAEAEFDRAIALDPDWGAAWASRGLYLERLGRAEEAQRDFLRAYELGVTETWLIERVERAG